MPRPSRPVDPLHLARLYAVSRTQGGLFLWRQALSAGLTDSQARTMLRAGAWTRVRHGVLHDPHVLACAARWLDLPNDAVIAAESAAVLHRLLYVAAPEQPVLAIARPRRGVLTAPRPGDLPAHHVERLLGIPVTTRARTVVDLLRTAEDRLRAQVLADGALREDVRREDVEAVLVECAGWPGIRQAREAWRHADARAESPLESEHRVLLRDAGFPAPELQVPVADAHGRTIARVDFLFREQRTIVESDGRVKYAETEGQPRTPVRELWHEKRREDQIRETGLEVVRAYASDRYDGGKDLAARVSRAFDRASGRAA